MSYYPIYGHPTPGPQPVPCCQPDPFYQPAPVHQPPPGYYPPQQDAQTDMPPAHCIVRQIVPINSHLVHVTETLTIPGELLPRNKPTSHRQREASEAYDHHSSQCKPKDQFRRHDQHRARLEQPLPPTKAIGYQARKQIDQQAWYSGDATTILPGPESSRDNADENGNDKKKPTSSQRVRTKGEPEEQKKKTSSQRVRTKGEPDEQKKSTSSQQVRTESEPEEQTRIREWVRSLPERKHKTKEPTSSKQAYTKGDPSEPSTQGHTQELIDSQPYVTDKQSKGSSVTGDERKRTTTNPTSVPHHETDSKRRPEKPAEQAKERGSTETTDTGRAHTTAHSSRNRPLRHEDSGTSTPAKKSAGHQSKKITKEEVQTVSLGKGRMRATVVYSPPKG